jgi:hypothetical protein
MYNAVLAASVITILINGLLLRFVPDRRAGKQALPSREAV